jgi:hypothetical protein
MAEQPPLSRIHVVGYSANDRDFPILNLVLDPRVAGYQVPKDLSACPDKRYPNHVFTGAQPISGDQRVRHVWEILPSPYVPFTRYDDDLGPVQGRRRSVKNEGQVASLAADKRVTYEAREGSAIVYTELEESWSVATDEDGNSLFPFKDRDFYDASRGPVQERRQLFVPTGEEVGSLENINGVITQTSYEPYNEFLSVKIVQTYKVDGPQLIGKATDNDGQLVTVTTQRKGANGYIPPNPTATRTVEVNREDAEALIERTVDTPEVFKANTFSVERPDPIPQKFRVAVPIQSSQEIVEGIAVTPTLEEGEISKSEEQRNKFIKRVSSTSRDQAVLPQTLTGKATNNERQEVTVTETLQFGNTDEGPTATKTIESEALGDGNYVITKTEVPEVFGAETYRKIREDITPQKFKAAQEDLTTEQNVAGIADSNISLATGEFAKSEQQVNKFVKRVSTTSRAISEAVVLVERVLTNEGQIGTRTLRLQVGDQTFTPSATLVDANVEALGDGRTVKTEVVVPNVFTGKSVVKTKVDLTPEKFRAAQQDTTTEESIEGAVNPAINLGTGEFRKSEQQVTEFVKRISSTTRDISASTDLTETVITNQGQVATRTLRLSATPQVIIPDALLVDGSIEALGDGRTIKTEVRVPEIFDEKSNTIEAVITVPERFLVNSPISSQAIVEAGDNTSVELSGGFISQQKQRISDFKIRTINRSQNINPSEILRGADYDDTLDAQIPFEEYISSTVPSGKCEVDPIGGGRHLVKEYDTIGLEQKLDAIKYVFPSRSTITGVPPVLRNFKVEWERTEIDSDSSSSSSGVGDGQTGSVSGSSNSSSTATGSVTPIFVIDLEEVNTSNIPTKSYFFFLKYPVTTANIISKIGGSVQLWPIFKPKSHVITATGQRLRVDLGRNISFNSNWGENSSSNSISLGQTRGIETTDQIFTVRIPPCLHGSFSDINKEEKQEVKASVSATVNIRGNVTEVPTISFDEDAVGKVNYNLGTTTPTNIPRTGIYLIDYRVEPYKFGYAKVFTETVDASIFQS